MASGGRRRRDNDPDIKLSKTLSYLLRHGAEKEGYRVHKGGFLYVDEILKFKQLRQFTGTDVKRIVETNTKKRFELDEDESGRIMIKAVQGHSLEVEELELTEVTNPADIPVVVHATNPRAWVSIKEQGLSRMGRNHVHFAPVLSDAESELPYFRKSASILIRINAERAMAAGLKFSRAANGVILCPGDADGKIDVQFFDDVFDRKSMKRLL